MLFYVLALLCFPRTKALDRSHGAVQIIIKVTFMHEKLNTKYTEVSSKIKTESEKNYETEHEP